MRSLVNMYHHSYTFFSFLLVFGVLLFRPASSQWKVICSFPNDECDMYERCGPNSYCNINTSPICNCIKGFDPKDPQEWRLSNWTGGCVRRMRLSCSKDGFVKLKNMKLPVVDDVIVHKRISTKECKEKCFGDCNCTAFANPVILNLGLHCMIWTGELIDIRVYADHGQDLYVRLAASELGTVKDHQFISLHKAADANNKSYHEI